MLLKHKVARVAAHAAPILPRRIRARLERVKNFLHAERQLREIFADGTLVDSEPGVWSVSPTPDSDKLSNFYSHQYWSGRSDSRMMLRPRDVDQFLYLRKINSEITGRIPAKALNFGSGHGGMSYLLVAAGFEVTNLDLFDVEVPGAIHVRSLDEVKGTFALIYASHSIEHVIDIRETMAQLIAQLQPGGYLFVEVPNSEYPAYVEGSGTNRKPRLHPPHTQYITRQYFTTLPLTTVALETICYEGSEVGRTVANASEGEVIRYVGRKS